MHDYKPLNIVHDIPELPLLMRRVVEHRIANYRHINRHANPLLPKLAGARRGPHLKVLNLLHQYYSELYLSRFQCGSEIRITPDVTSPLQRAPHEMLRSYATV